MPQYGNFHSDACHGMMGGTRCEAHMSRTSVGPDHWHYASGISLQAEVERCWQRVMCCSLQGPRGALCPLALRSPLPRMSA